MKHLQTTFSYHGAGNHNVNGMTNSKSVHFHTWEMWWLEASSERIGEIKIHNWPVSAFHRILSSVTTATSIRLFDILSDRCYSLVVCLQYCSIFRALINGEKFEIFNFNLVAKVIWFLQHFFVSISIPFGSYSPGVCQLYSAYFLFSAIGSKLEIFWALWLVVWGLGTFRLLL